MENSKDTAIHSENTTNESTGSISGEGGCFYCSNIEYHKIVSVNHFKNIDGVDIQNIDTPYRFCANCGRKLGGVYA
jgi:hypothetical protein